MKVGVVYTTKEQQLWLKVDLEDGADVQAAIDKSGLLNYCPEIDLKTQKVGVFGKVVKLDSPLNDGDRVEVYRRIIRKLDDDDDDED